MKKIKTLLIIIVASVLLWSCSKEDDLVVDLTKYNSDNYVATEADHWISTNLTDPYNIEVVYRFERDLTDVSRNISPVEYEKVQPMMEMVLDGFIKSYEKVAGATFIKTYTPKQFVLYGSPSYNSDGSITLGTAEGGRKIVLYELNHLDFDNPDNVKRPLRTIHHEFTHIVNQIVAIPVNFEEVTEADYYTDWTNNTTNSATIAKELGFVSRYARSSATEDFAEMTSHLLVEGQVWFNNYVLTAPLEAQQRLRQKERIVRDYFKTFFNIDFDLLQAEVQSVLKNKYHATDPEDLTQTLPIWLLSNKVSYIRYDPVQAHYTQYGSSAAFTTLYNKYRDAVKAQGYTLNYIEFRFTDASNMVFRANISGYLADYNFKLTVNQVNGEVVFTKTLPEGTGTAYSNGQFFINSFESAILPYLVNRTFIAAWLPGAIDPDNSLYRTFGGFYVKGTPSNYFYGPIVLK